MSENNTENDHITKDVIVSKLEILANLSFDSLVEKKILEESYRVFYTLAFMNGYSTCENETYKMRSEIMKLLTDK